MTRPRKPPTVAEEQRAVDAFNAEHRPGLRVRYWSGPRSGAPTGLATTTAEAEVWCRETATVRVRRDDGKGDVIALSHVEPHVEP